MFGDLLKYLPLIEKLIDLLGEVIKTNREVAETTRENTRQLAALKGEDNVG